MPRGASPWVLLVASTFIAYFGLLVYCDIVRPEEYGYRARVVDGRLVVTSIAATPDTPASRAGLVPGDVIVAANGLMIESAADWALIDQNIEFGRPIHLTVDRGHRTLDRVLALSRAGWVYWTTEPGMLLLAALSVQCVALVVAVVIALKRPDDRIALLGAWALGTAAVYTVVPPARFAAVWRALPTGVGAMLWVPYISSLSAPAVLSTFFSSFPRRLIHSSSLWMAAWVPMAIVLIGPIRRALLMVYEPAHAMSTAPSSGPMIAATAVYVLAGLSALVLNCRRLTDANERRRVRIVVVGAVAGLLPGMVAVAFYRLRTDADVAASIFASPTTALGTISLLLFPASFAYAILRHRVFDLKLIIRLGVRYAIARGALLSVVPLLALLLVVDVVRRGNAPLAVTFERRAWVYAVIAGLGVAAHLRRRQWFESLDRRFFREQYNTHRLLRRVVDDTGHEGDLTRVAPRVVAHIEAALHPEFVALLVRAPSDLSFRCLAAAPVGLAPPPLRVDSTVLALLRVLRTPLQVSASAANWLAQHLTRAELEPLREGRIELLVPIVTAADGSESLLTLGVKRSEEPYTEEDSDLLAIIAAHLALLVGRPGDAVPRRQATLAECSQCGACYDGDVHACEHDESRLVPRSVPRVFASRYRLDRRLGGGGFGTVYEAFDTALDRRVALKTIREDLLTRPDIAQRFQREARLAAGFVHPNVVTVYDFGVDASARAFIVMERLDGTTLRDELLRHARLSPTRALAIMRDVCAAMEAAHRRHLVHRDLKPENICLIHDGRHETAKVLDFGVARALNDAEDMLRNIDGLVGTVRYMAPAQLRGEDLGSAGDLWALGVIAYEMLTGSHPFARVVTAGIPALPLDPFEVIAPPLADAPAAWTTFFGRALALESEGRPDTPGRFLAELEEALACVAA
jgi:tRNA A-37 threonylcarbamoyl transferase component Bud32